MKLQNNASILSFTILCILFIIQTTGAPNIEPYHVWCYVVNFPREDYADSVYSALLDLVRKAPVYWEHRSGLEAGPNARGKFFKLESSKYISNEENTACLAVIHWRGGCRETATCKSREDCVECLNVLARELAYTYCPHNWKGSAYTLDCFAYFTINSEFPVGSRIAWPPYLNQE